MKKKRYILGISSSPRYGGNTDVLLDAALAGARSSGASTEKIILNCLDFKPCQECGGCDDTGVCVIPDDMRMVYKKVSNADGIIMASPVFFGSLTAQAKAMIDRFECAWIAKYILKKRFSRKDRKGVFLCASACNKRKFFNNALSIVKNFFATIDVKFSGSLFCPGVDEEGSVTERKNAINKAFDLGRKVAL